MAKDNPATKQGPDELPASNSNVGPKKKGRRTKNERLRERLKRAGVFDTKGLTQEEMQAILSQLKKEGKKIPTLNSDNGRPASLNRDPRAKDIKEKVAFEEITVTIKDKHGKEREEKKTALEVMLTKLRRRAMETNDDRVMGYLMEKFFDRTLGKAPQELDINDINPDEQRIPTEDEMIEMQVTRELLKKRKLGKTK